MLLKILMAAISVAVMIITPFFVKAQKDGPCVKSLILKMTAATGYLLIGVLGTAYKGSITKFDRILFIALILSWIGDLFLHLWQKKIYPVIGFLGFFSAHFFFIAAYLNGIAQVSPGRGFFSVPEIAFVVIFDICFIIYAVVTKMNLKGVIAVPIVMYATVITTMFCKAFLLGFTSVKSGAENGMLIAVFAVLGAALFVMSDFSISILMFNEKRKTDYKLKMFNMLTYYAAELLLAGLVLFY